MTKDSLITDQDLVCRMLVRYSSERLGAYRVQLFRQDPKKIDGDVFTLMSSVVQDSDFTMDEKWRAITYLRQLGLFDWQLNPVLGQRLERGHNPVVGDYINYFGTVAMQPFPPFSSVFFDQVKASITPRMLDRYRHLKDNGAEIGANIDAALVPHLQTLHPSFRAFFTEEWGHWPPTLEDVRAAAEGAVASIGPGRALCNIEVNSSIDTEHGFLGYVRDDLSVVFKR